MSAPNTIPQFCWLLTYPPSQFPEGGGSPVIGLYATVDPVDDGSPGLQLRIERCDGGGCVDFEFLTNVTELKHNVDGDPFFEFVDGATLPETTYRYQARLENVDGVSAYSAIEVVATIASFRLPLQSGCDSGVPEDINVESAETGTTFVAEYLEAGTDGEVDETGSMMGPEWIWEEVMETGVTTNVDYLLAEVRETGMRIILEYKDIPVIPPEECPREPGTIPERTEPCVDVFSTPFRLYQKDVEVRMKSWGDDTAYSIVRPFGGPSFERGAAI